MLTPRRLEPEEIAGCVDRTLAGEPQAFEALVEAYSTMAWSIAYSIVRNPDGAQEVSQQAWVEAFANLGQLREKGKFGAWLARIARFRAYSYASDRRRRSLSLEEGGVEPEAPKPEDPAERDPGDAGRWVRRAVEDLPERYRQIFLLKHLDGRSHEEMSEMTGLSVKGVAKRLNRARLMLLDRWKRSGGKT